jgi:hypothetical protein
MPTFDDAYGVQMTIQNLRTMHADYVNDIQVVDNNPGSDHGLKTAGFCSNVGRIVTYTPYTEKMGTAPAKNKAIEMAKTNNVVCLDSHVILMPYFFPSLITALSQVETPKFMLQGAILKDNLSILGTCFDSTWSGQMWGQWSDTPEHLAAKRGEVLPLYAMGMGCFYVDKRTWPGFNPQFYGFGGEEIYIHEKYRKLGGSCYFVGGMEWWHRFLHIGQRAPALLEHKVRNYILGLTEVGISLDECRAHFISASKMSGQRFDEIVANPDSVSRSETSVISLIAPPPTQPCCGQAATGAAPAKSPLAGHYAEIVDVCKGKNVALLCDAKAEMAGVLAAEATQVLTALSNGQIDVVFIDEHPHGTQQVYDQMIAAENAGVQTIILHDTEAPYKEQVLPAIVTFMTSRIGKWFTYSHFTHDHGLTVISRDPDLMPPALPSLIQMGWSFLKSTVKDVGNSLERVPSQVETARREICESNGGRCPVKARRIDDDTCSSCGCPLSKKLVRPLEMCPHSFWGPYRGDGEEYGSVSDGKLPLPNVRESSN